MTFHSSSSDNDETYIGDATDTSRRNVIVNAIAGGLLVSSGVATWQLYNSQIYTPTDFVRIPTQFIAALGDPKAQSGTNANEWGLWNRDPGPQGFWLREYDSVKQNSGTTPNGWTLDPEDFWVEEHGIVMPPPSFPLKAGRYLVTGGRSLTTGLTIQADGSWKLDEGTLYDVTHLPCRSARYVTTDNDGPRNVRPSDFPVMPGAVMPPAPGCEKQDYAVLFVVGKQK
jgi:hypothetical protein